MFAKYPGERELVPTWAREELMQSNLCNLDQNPVFVLLGAIILGPKKGIREEQRPLCVGPVAGKESSPHSCIGF